MEQELLRILEKFYKKLQDNVIRSEKRLLHDSVLLTLINVKSNTTSKLLNVYNEILFASQNFSNDFFANIKSTCCAAQVSENPSPI